MEPASHDERALQEVSLNDVHNHPHFQGPAGGYIAPHGARGQRGLVNDHDGIGRHLDDNADGDMMSDELMNEGPTACALGGGLHGHTQSCQMTGSYVSGVAATGGLNRKHSKGKIHTTSYQTSQQSRPHGTGQGARKSLTKPKSQAGRGSGATTAGNVTTRNSTAAQQPSGHSRFGPSAAQNSHMTS